MERSNRFIPGVFVTVFLICRTICCPMNQEPFGECVLCAEEIGRGCVFCAEDIGRGMCILRGGNRVWNVHSVRRI